GGDSPLSFQRPPPPHVAGRETTAIVARLPSRGEALVPGTKDCEHQTDESAPDPTERLSGGRSSGVDDDDEVRDAWPWPANPPRASPSCRGKPHRFYYFHHQ
ncbi:unnamed protein product, partial [Ectocarpus sp. 8 AP-2014]